MNYLLAVYTCTCPSFDTTVMEIRKQNPDLSSRCFHASYHHRNNSFSFIREPASLIDIAAMKNFVSVFYNPLQIPSGILFLRHNNLTKFFVDKRKKGGFRREKLSKNRLKMVLHR